MILTRLGLIMFQRRTSIPTTLTSTTTSVDTSSKKLVVFVNPKSGDGRAVRMFEKSVRPSVEHSGIPFELIMTQRFD